MTRAALVNKTRIKICGITSMAMAEVAVEAGADAIGLVFIDDSPRAVLPGAAYRIAASLPPFVSAVGVFCDPPDPELKAWPGRWVQLHGNETEHQLRRVAQTKRTVKGFRFDPDQVWRWDRCDHADALLIDGSAGGRGSAFHHSDLAELMPRTHKPVILAGGLTPQNVGEAIRIVRPFGVDVSSGVEKSRGVKDPKLIRRFCEAVRKADAELITDR